jgi:hypothetical protein
MDWWALQNQKVDRNAKAFLKKCKLKKRPHQPVRLLYEKWALSIKGVKKSKINKNSLYASLFAPRTLSYWENHHGIKTDPHATVDWEASYLAMAKLPQGYKRWLVEQLSGHIGVGHMLKNGGGKTTHAAPYATLKIKKHPTSSSVETYHQKKTLKNSGGRSHPNTGIQ